MLHSIEEASKNFCIHQIREAHTVTDGPSKKRTLIAYIDIETNSDQKHRVYVGADKPFVQRISKLFLEEDESDDETLIDMALETANLIVGSAKVLADSTTINGFNIGTPNFVKFDVFDLEYDDAKTLAVASDEIFIAIKEIHG